MNYDFFEVKKLYNKLREEERLRIIDYLKSKGLKVTKQGGKGSMHYNNFNSLKKEYDLTNWKWVSTTIENKAIFISLQAFDQDKDSKNFHVLFDRIGLCVYPSEIKKPNYFNLMETTSFELPLDKYDLEELYSLILEKTNKL